MPEPKLWEKYLVYATIFNLNDKLQKDMETLINNSKLKKVPNTISDGSFNKIYHSLITSFSEIK